MTNNVETYINCSGVDRVPFGMEYTKEELGRRVEILSGMVQALLDRIAEKEGMELGFMPQTSVYGKNVFRIYGHPKEKEAEVALGDNLK